MLGGEGLSVGWAHSYLSAINGATNSKRESTRNGEGRERELTLCLRIDILDHGNPLRELTLNRFIVDFDSRKRTKNLGSGFKIPLKFPRQVTQYLEY